MPLTMHSATSHPRASLATLIIVYSLLITVPEFMVSNG
jgi:hypothetical protein